MIRNLIFATVVGGLVGPAQGEQTVIFDGELGHNLMPMNRHGGNFQAHARLVDGRLEVRVPDGAQWGKVGIMSKEPVVWLDGLGEDAEVVVTVTLDPATTTGFVIALPSSGWGEEMWSSEPFRPLALLHWKPAIDDTPGEAILYTDTRKVYPHVAWKTSTGPRPPREIRFRITSGQLKVEAEGIDQPAVDWPLARRWQGLRVYAYAHAFAANEAVSFTLEKITVEARGGTPESKVHAGGGGADLPVEILFTGAPGERWRPIPNAAPFETYGRFEAGAMIVEVPEGGFWVKPGLISTEPMLLVDRHSERAPMRLTFVVDPDRTTGFAIATNYRPHADQWAEHDSWSTWIIGKDGRPMISLHGTNTNAASRPSPRGWSGRYEVIFGPDWIVAGPVEGPKIILPCWSLMVDQLKYVSIVAHPVDKSEPATLALQEIHLDRLSPPGMDALESWVLQPDEEFDRRAYTRLLADEIHDILLREETGE